MKKSLRDAFDSAYIKTLKSKTKTMVPNKKGDGSIVVIPLSTVIKNFNIFIKKVKKELNVK